MKTMRPWSGDLYEPIAVEERQSSETSGHPLYQPRTGELVEDNHFKIRGGELFLGHYVTELASHPVGVYRPDDFDPSKELPVVTLTTPLGTGVGKHSHNDGVAKEFMRDDLAVVVKGVPRYHRPTLHAVGLNQDANEQMGMINLIERSRILGKIPELRGYGESQAAMKLFFMLAIAGFYGQSMPNGLAVAPCYMDKLHFDVRKIGRHVSMGRSLLNFAVHTSGKELWQKRGTFHLKDTLHHAIVIPVLTSGETGRSLPYIGEDQCLDVDLFGKDDDSSPYATQAKLSASFPNMNVSVNPKYGHVDGIMSEETRIHRGIMVLEAKIQAGISE